MSEQQHGIDKKFLYGQFQAGEDRKAKLHDRVVHKALDMAMEDDVQIQANKTGIGALGVAGIATAAGLPASLVALALMFGGKDSPTATAPTPPSPVAPHPLDDSNYSVFFWELDEHGNKVRRVKVDPLNQVEPSK